MPSRLSQGRRAIIVGLAVNSSLAFVKLLAGLAGHSYALVADAVESFSDMLSSVVVWGGLSLASKPPDDDHPYGHGRAEPLAALAVAMILGGAACGIALQAIREIQTPHHSPAAFTLFVLLGVVAVKEALYRYVWRAGSRIDSTAMRADAWHHRGDALTSLAAAVGITIALIGGPGYESADDWAALAACMVIVVNGARFARVAISELMDTAPGTDRFGSIRKAALAVDDALSVEKILVRKLGPTYYVDLHLGVNPGATVRQAHGVAHAVKDSIIRRHPEIADVLVHIEPHDDPNGRD